MQRRTRGSASLPAPGKWLGPITSTLHTDDSTLTNQNKGLRVGSFLERFLDRVKESERKTRVMKKLDIRLAGSAYRSSLAL